MVIQTKNTPEKIESSIRGVADSQGTFIPNPGTTADTVLTLSGIGTANSRVYIVDSGVQLTSVPVTINGTWSFDTETLVLGRHVFTVRDSLGGADSPDWVITLDEADVSPEIIRVVDGAGNEIPDQGKTEDSSITLHGTASPSQQVELFDYAATLAVVPVDINGDWVFLASQIGAKTYSITAKGLYGSFPASRARVFTVEVASDPIAITSIKDAIGAEVPPGSITSSLSLTLVGTAVAGEGVQILDGDNVMETETVSSAGTWTSSLPGLAEKKYNLKARGLYGSRPESPVWELTIVAGSGKEDFELEEPRTVIGTYRFASGLVVSVVSPGVMLYKLGHQMSLGLVPATARSGEFILPNAAREVDFFWNWTSPSFATAAVVFDFFDPSERPIGTRSFTFAGDWGTQHTVFSAPALNDVGSFKISVNGTESRFGMSIERLGWTV